MMFIINERVRLKVDPRVEGKVIRWLTTNWNGVANRVRVRWDGGELEDLPVSKIEKSHRQTE